MQKQWRKTNFAAISAGTARAVGMQKEVSKLIFIWTSCSGFTARRRPGRDRRSVEVLWKDSEP